MRLRVLSVLAVLALAAAPQVARAQGEALLTGKVTSVAGAPVEGAQVFLEKMSLGTQTKADGSYRFAVPAARATGQPGLLTVRLQGFKPKSVTVTLSPGTINTDFALETQAVVLQQLVITGEGTITTNEKLGATVNNVGGEDITKSNEPNLTAALAGKAPNVNVTSQSADPGGSVNIQIRGVKTFSGDGQPLFIVDGVPVDNSSINTQGQFANNMEQGTVNPNRIADLNPNDVESVTILKGSAAAAIYGARAAQGVVLITTKSGKFRQDAVLAALVVLVRQGHRGLSAPDHVRSGEQRLPRQQRRGARHRCVLLQPQLGTAARLRDEDVQPLQRDVRDRPRCRQQPLDLRR